MAASIQSALRGAVEMSATMSIETPPRGALLPSEQGAGLLNLLATGEHLAARVIAPSGLHARLESITSDADQGRSVGAESQDATPASGRGNGEGPDHGLGTLP
jgi:hypothetical protein